MSTWVVVDVRPQGRRLAIEAIDGFPGGQQRRQGIGGFETAIVPGVIRQQSGPGGQQSGQVRVVRNGRQVVRQLLGVAQVLEMADPGEKAGIAGDRVGQGHVRVQGTDDNGLPTASR